jgi:very-short-patch-repair endonuclease
MNQEKEGIEFILLEIDPYFENYTIETEYKFLEDRKFHFDIAIPELKIAIELNGGIWSGGRHTNGTNYEKDLEKINLAQANGWRVFQFTYSTMFTAKEFLKNNLDKLIK